MALIRNSHLKSAAGGLWEIQAPSLQEKLQVCDGERFREQPVAAFCSGFLVAPDQVVTAAHCVESESELATFRIVFDYRVGAGSALPRRVPKAPSTPQSLRWRAGSSATARTGQS